MVTFEEPVFRVCFQVLNDVTIVNVIYPLQISLHSNPDAFDSVTVVIYTDPPGAQ